MNILRNKRARKVSVVVPNYNYGKFLQKRTKSIVRQTYPIYELIILDDASKDKSLDEIYRILAWLNREYPDLKVRFVPNKKNSGKAILQWKKGFEEARGDFVWIAEADDLSSRRFLAGVMGAFDDSEVVMSYAESMVINGMGLMLAPNFRWSRDKEKSGHFSRSYVKEGTDEIREIMAIRCTVPNVSGVVFRKSAVPLRLLDEAAEFSQVGDWYLYAKLLGEGKIAYNRRSLNRFRVHGGSVTGQARGAKKHLDEVKEMHEMFRRKYELDERVMAAMGAEEKRMEERSEKA